MKLNNKLIKENKLVIYCFMAPETDERYKFKKKFKYKIESGSYKVKAYSKKSKMYRSEGFEIPKIDFRKSVFSFKEHVIKLKKPSSKVFSSINFFKPKKLSAKKINSFKEMKEFEGLNNGSMRSSIFDKLEKK